MDCMCHLNLSRFTMSQEQEACGTVCSVVFLLSTTSQACSSVQGGTPDAYAPATASETCAKSVLHESGCYPGASSSWCYDHLPLSQRRFCWLWRYWHVRFGVPKHCIAVNGSFPEARESQAAPPQAGRTCESNRTSKLRSPASGDLSRMTLTNLHWHYYIKC